MKSYLLVMGAALFMACAPTSEPSAPITASSAVPTSAVPPGTPTSPATAIPAKSLVVSRFSQSGTALAVEISNPNADVGLVRASFEAAAIAVDNSVIKVLGTSGLPGALCCTVYQLPPGGRYAFLFDLPAGASPVSKVEFTVPRPNWVKWSEFKAANATVAGAMATSDSFSTHVTGRVAIDQSAALNVVILNLFEDSVGKLVFVVSGVVDCVADSPRAFDIQASFAKAPAGAKLKESIAYATTISGVVTGGGTPQPCGR